MKHSRSNEAAVVESLIEATPDIVRYFIDIGAGDGTIWSNTHDLLLAGWSGLAIECDEIKLLKLNDLYARYQDRASVARVKATPSNISQLLSKVPPAPGFLSLDIDGYDYHVLKALLATHQPQIICLEINTNIPPPFKFSVRYDPTYWWAGNTFFGMSASAACELLSPHGYNPMEVVFDNVIFSKCHPAAHSLIDLWQKGFLDASDPDFDYNRSICRRLLALPPSDAINEIDKMYANYAGKYDLWL